MSGRFWPHASRHKYKNTENHALALLSNFDEIDEASKYGKSRLPKFPPLLEKLISTGISEGLAEASSIGYSLALTSECDKQRLHDIVFKKIETQAATLARAQVPERVYHSLAKSYRRFLPKLRDLLAANGLDHSRERDDVAMAQALGLARLDAEQECWTLDNKEARAATLREESVAPIAKDVAYCDRGNENEAEEDEGAKVHDIKGVEERKDEEANVADKNEGGNEDSSMGSDNPPKLPEPGVNDDIYNPNNELHEPLAHRSLVVFGITSQAVVNVLYDMDSRELFQALCMAIKKKKQKFLGTSYLSNVSLSDNGDVTAITNNDKAEDMSLLLQLSGWDSDIVDNDLGMNFGSRRCYRVHMSGVKKENSLSGDLASRKQKATLISELVRVNLTTLSSLRIHHIKDIDYIEGSEESSKALAIDFHDLEQAYAALSRGLNYNGTHFDCETLQREEFLARCRYCQANGHTHKVCSNAPRCGKCAQQHKTKYCRTPHEKCALCDGWGHGSRSPTCPVKQAEKNSVRFTTISSGPSQAVEQLENTAPQSRLQEINDVANRAEEFGFFSDLDTPTLLINVLNEFDQRFQRIEESLKPQPQPQNTSKGGARKRHAVEPLVNDASTGSVKRIK